MCPKASLQYLTLKLHFPKTRSSKHFFTICSMAGIPFLCLAFLDLVMGSLIIAPLVRVIESVIPHPPDLPYLTVSGALRWIALPEPLILLVIGLFWTLAVACSDNTGLGWNW